MSLALVVASVASVGGAQAVRSVPSTLYPTIQSAIDASQNGDTVSVLPGTYPESVSLKGKDLVLRSSRGAHLTTIAGTGTALDIPGPVGPSTVVEGFSFVDRAPIPGADLVVCGIDASPTIRGNRFVNHDGTGLQCLRIDNGLIEGNLFDRCRDGGIAIHYGLRTTIRGNLITNCSAPAGGAISMNPAAPTIEYNTLIGNFSEDGGGAIYSTGGTIRGNYIASNSSTGNGGGVLIECASTLVEGNTFAQNVAIGQSGGGLAVSQLICTRPSSSPIVRNNMFFGNAALRGGGLLVDWGNTARVVNNTFAANNATQDGGAAFFSSQSSPLATVTLINTIVAGNTAPVGRSFAAVGGMTVTLAHCLVEVGAATGSADARSTINWGAGMQVSRPFFVDPARADFRLRYDSTARDAGDNSAAAVLPHDFEGDPRDARVDIGADEYAPRLYSANPVARGKPVVVRVMSPPGKTALLGVSVTLAPAPIVIPRLGSLALDPAGMQLIPLGPAGGSGVIDLQVLLPPFRLYAQAAVDGVLTNTIAVTLP